MLQHYNNYALGLASEKMWSFCAENAKARNGHASIMPLGIIGCKKN